MTTRTVGKGNCPACGSTDNVSLFTDDDSEIVKGKCWTPGCNKFYKDYYAELDGKAVTPPENSFESKEDNKVTLSDLPFRTHSERKISSSILEMFSVRSTINPDGEVEQTFYPYKKPDGISYKIRSYPKTFSMKGGLQNVFLFGQDKFEGSSRKRLVITEGEEDALAVAEAYKQYNGNIYPVVSIPSASNLNPVLENISWIKGFEEVVLYIDNDEAGANAVIKLAKAIGYSKCKVAKGEFKDASDELTKSSTGSKAVLQAIWNAKVYNPQGILRKEQLKKAMKEYAKIKSVPYPPCFEGLNEKLKGMREGEITLWTSGTGSGKSTMLREIVYHLQQTTDDLIGVISLEEAPAETTKKLSCMAINKNPTAESISEEELDEGFEKVFGDDRIIVLDHAGAITDGIVSQLEYMASIGCKYLFIDHITILVSEGAEGLSGNEAIDKIMNDLLKVAKTFNVWIGLVSHLRKTSGGKSFEEGQLPSLDDIKGSGSIKQISMDIIAFARDSGSSEETTRNTIEMKVLKCRYTGLTGPAGAVSYDYNTGRIQEKVLEL